MFARAPATSGRFDFFPPKKSQTFGLKTLPPHSPFKIATVFAVVKTPVSPKTVTSLDSEVNELAKEDLFPPYEEGSVSSSGTGR